MKDNMSSPLTCLKRYIKYTEAFRDFDEVYKNMVTYDSEMMLPHFFDDVNTILTNIDKVGEITDEIKQQYNETVDNMRWKDVKHMSLKIEYEFERLITQLKISRDSSRLELLNRVDNMTTEEI